jgi:hypothetical protein
MCRAFKIATTRLSDSIHLIAVAGLLAVFASHESAQAQICGTGLGGAISLNTGGPVHIGDTITITGILAGNQPTSLAASNITAWLLLPNGTTNKAMENVNLPAGTTCDSVNGVAGAGFLCPGNITIGAGVSGTCDSFPTTYTVRAQDVGQGVTFAATGVNGFQFNCSQPGQPKKIVFEEAVLGQTVQANPQAASACPVQILQVIFPGIAITKNCVNQCTPIGSPIQFSGVVTNTGDVTLNSITVTDDPNATITFSTTTFLGNSFPANGDPATAVLAAGDSVSFTGSYTPSGTAAALCGPFTDTIQVTGADITGFTVTNTATATCHVQVNPAITLTKDCFKTGSPGVRNLQPGDTYVEVFVVKNTGDVGLTGVIIHDDVQGNITVGDLGSGQSVTNTTGPITPAPGVCGPITDHATATGTNLCPADDVCPSARTVTSAQQQCTVTVLCAPNICVSKGITCAPATGAACDGTLTYGSTASGVVGPTNQTAFCYQIIVANCLPSADVLVVTNISDNLISPLTGFETPFTLQIGQARTNYYKQSYGAGTHVNTVSAIGFGQASGVVTNAQASATATVVPISVTCALNLTNDFQVNTSPVNNCDVQLAAGTSNAAVQVILTINNTGQGDLNVSVIGGSILSTTPLVDCATGASIAPPVVFVPAGQTVVTNIGCVTVSCPGATVSATIQGTAVASTGIPCIFDTAGNAVTTAPSSCQNCVNCAIPAVPLECRVTGGGTLYAGVTDTNCVVLTTVLFDDEQCAGSVLDHISHGGQLGAPFNQRDCGQILGDPCIRGEWEHNRHYQGSGNPKDTIDTKFHSYNANVGAVKGVFDSLECACLGCCSGGEFIGSATNNALCNPTDHKICGPEPRPAPANAIIFSGLGVFQPAACGASGKNQPLRWFVFRVYIEDRSEPGGLHPGGAKEPADVYCFQAWDTGVTVTKHSDASTVATTFRQCLAADNCAFIESISTSSNTGVPPGTLPSATVCGMSADINDCGPLYDGNQQIHPSTGATCTATTPLTIISP